jgi:hypothetical protein
MGLTRAERRARTAAALRDRAAIDRRGIPPSIRVHIEELVLHGFPAAGARRIADGLGVELTRLFGSTGLPPAMSAAHGAPIVDAGTIHAATPQAAGGSRLGGAIARAVYGARRP